MVAAVDYVRSRLKSLGYEEIKKELSDRDFPRSMENRNFSLEYRAASNVKNDHQHVAHIDMPITVKLGFSIKNKNEDKRQYLEKAEIVLRDLCDITNWKNAKIVFCKFQSLETVQNEANSRFLLLRMDFNTRSLVPLRKA